MRKGFDMPVEPFDYDRITKSFGDFILTYMKAALGPPGATPDAEFGKKFEQFFHDAGALHAEVKRLRDILSNQMKDHLPHPGEAGAPTICGFCSLSGSQVVWPCVPFKTAQRALEGDRG